MTYLIFMITINAIESKKCPLIVYVEILNLIFIKTVIVIEIKSVLLLHMSKP